MTEFHGQIKIDEAKACLQSRCIMQNEMRLGTLRSIHGSFSTLTLLAVVNTLMALLANLGEGRTFWL